MLPNDVSNAKYISLSVDDFLNATSSDDDAFVGRIFRQLAIAILNTKTDDPEKPLELTKLQQRLEDQLEESVRKGWENHKKQTGGLRRGNPKPKETQEPKRRFFNNEDAPAVGKNGALEIRYNEK